MKNLVRLWVIVGSLALSALGAAQTPGGADNVTRAVLPNGLRVVIVRNPLAPVVTTMINYEVGSDEAPDGFPGMAHAMEHMMFRGSPGLSAAQLANLSAAIGGDNNADTQQSVTQYFFTTPAEDLDIALHIEALRMRGLESTEALWGKERGAIEQEVAQDLSNPEYVFYTNLLAVVFHGAPYEHDALGSRPSFDKTTGAMLKQFHDSWYVPNNAVLVICGDVQPEAALASVKELFRDVPAGVLPARPDFAFQPVPPQTIKVDTDLPTGLAIIAFRMAGSDSPDYAATQVLNDVLGSQRDKLYGLVPQGKALFAGFEYNGMPHAGLGFAIGGYPAGGNPDTLLAEINRVLAEELKQGLSEDLIEASKRHEVASLEFQKDSVSGLANAWSQAVAVEGRQSPEDDVQAIRQVTVADVNRVARQYLDTNHAVIAILTPRPSGKPISEKTFGGKESFAVSEGNAVKLPDWAARALARLELPHSTLHPTVTVLANGLTLIVQPESSSDSVNVYGRIKSDANLEEGKGKEGVNDLLGQLFSYGSKSLDRLAFQKALDDIAANESAGTDFSLQVLSEDFERGVELLAQNELTPALPPKDFPVAQDSLASEVAGQLKTPSYLQKRALRKAVYPAHDPSQRQATPGTIKGLKLEDVVQFHQEAFRPDLATIVVIGRVTPERAAAAVNQYFGSWSARGPKPPTVPPAVPPNKPWTARVPDTSRVQDDVTLAETVGVTLGQPDRYALELGNHVLGGGFYATRLYHDLREEGGLVYYVGSSLQFGESRSLYRVSYACDPPNVAKARAIIVSNLKAMQERDVTPDELIQAKGLLLREIPLSEASIDRVAQGWLDRASHGQPLDEPMRAAQHYLDLTAPEVRAAFSQWLRPSDLVQVTLGP